MATMKKSAWIYVGSTALTGGEALKWSSQGKCDLATAVTDLPIGIAAEACAAGNVVGQNISVWALYHEPTVQVIASAAISAGAKLTVTTGGKMVTAVPKATLSESEEYIWGYANEAAANADEVIEMVWVVYQTSIT